MGSQRNIDMAGAGATVKKRRLDEFMNDHLSVHLACQSLEVECGSLIISETSTYLCGGHTAIQTEKRAEMVEELT